MPDKKDSKKKPESGSTTTVRLDSAVHHRAKVYAAIHGQLVQSVLAAALDEYLKKRGA